MKRTIWILTLSAGLGLLGFLGEADARHRGRTRTVVHHWSHGVWAPGHHHAVILRAPRGLSPFFGYVDTDVLPEEARVYLDGAYLGQADDHDGFPGLLRLEPGRHVIEFRLEDHRTLRLRLKVDRGQLIRVSERLSPVL